MSLPTVLPIPPSVVAGPSDRCPERALRGSVGLRRELERLMTGVACSIGPPSSAKCRSEDGGYGARSRSTSGIASEERAPGLAIGSAATALPHRSDSAIAEPRSREAMKPASNTAPAPTVSTMETARPGTTDTPSSERPTAPAEHMAPEAIIVDHSRVLGRC